jgi:hypothetical protein
MEFKHKVIAFLDILGWKKLVEDAEACTGLPPDDLVKLLDCFGTGSERERFEQTGPKCCPEARYQERNLDFRLTQVSDCAIVSAEVSPAGVINLLWHSWRAVFQLLEHGIMTRGYVKVGAIYHTEKHFIGSGYQETLAAEKEVDAFKREASECGTPFVQIDPTVTNLVESCGDACVQKMFSRLVRIEGGTVALFPFQRLEHQFIVAAPGYTFNAQRQRESNNNLRKKIERYKEIVESHVDRSNPDAVRKSRHYLAALDAQLAVCDDTERVIDKFDSQRPRGTGP